MTDFDELNAAIKSFDAGRSDSARYAYEGQCVREILKAMDKESSKDLWERCRSDAFTFEALQGGMSHPPVILVVSEASLQKKMSIVDAMKRGSHPPIVRAYHDEAKAFRRAEQGVAVFIKTVEQVPVVVHQLVNAGTEEYRNQTPRLHVPGPAGSKNAGLVIEPRRTFVRLYADLVRTTY